MNIKTPKQIADYDLSFWYLARSFLSISKQNQWSLWDSWVNTENLYCAFPPSPVIGYFWNLYSNHGYITFLHEITLAAKMSEQSILHHKSLVWMVTATDISKQMCEYQNSQRNCRLWFESFNIWQGVFRQMQSGISEACDILAFTQKIRIALSLRFSSWRLFKAASIKEEEITLGKFGLSKRAFC